MRKTNGFSENTIVSGIQNNDRKVFEYLYQEMVPYIYQDVVKNSGTEEDAKDHFQEVMLVVTQNVKRNKYEVGNIKGYIRKVAQNLWHKKLRNKGFESFSGHEDNVQEESDYEKYLTLLQHEREIKLVEQALKQMGNPCREVLTWHYYHKTSLKEIAKDFNWTYAYCKKKVYECRKQMKNLIGRNRY